MLKSNCHITNIISFKYYESIWIQLIFAKIENEKYYSKIIFKCVNNTIKPIFNIFKYVNSTATVCEQYCSVHEQ